MSKATGCLDKDVLMPPAHGRAGAATLGTTPRFEFVAAETTSLALKR